MKNSGRRIISVFWSAKSHFKSYQGEIRWRSDSNLLPLLKILPKEVSLKSNFRHAKNIALEEKSLPSVYEEVNIDSFLNTFIERDAESVPIRSAISEPSSMPSPNIEINSNIEMLELPVQITPDEDIREMKYFETTGIFENLDGREHRKIFKL